MFSSIDNWIIDGILRHPFGADLHCSIHTSMLINVDESVVKFRNKDIIDISIGSVNPDVKRLLEYSVNSPVVYVSSYACTGTYHIHVALYL